MHRRSCICLTVLAAAMVLAVGTNRPAGAQLSKAPSFVQAFPNSNSALVTWGGVVDAASYNIFRRAQGETPDKAVKVNQQPNTVNFFIDSGLTNGKPLFYSVKAVFKDGSEGPASPEAVVTPHDPIQGIFFLNTIGTLIPGEVSVEGNVLTIKAGGDDIWDQQDGQAFLATPVAGDYQITVKLLAKPVAETGDGDNFAKVGPQIKSDLMDGAPYGLNFASIERDILFEGRKGLFGGDPGNFGGGGTSFDETKYPLWLRIVKKTADDVTTLSAFQSFDGKTYTAVGEPQEMGRWPVVTYAGVAATAHGDDDPRVVGKIELPIVIEPAP